MEVTIEATPGMVSEVWLALGYDILFLQIRINNKKKNQLTNDDLFSA
jgi:hypothetical protein